MERTGRNAGNMLGSASFHLYPVKCQDLARRSKFEDLANANSQLRALSHFDYIYNIVHIYIEHEASRYEINTNDHEYISCAITGVAEASS